MKFKLPKKRWLIIGAIVVGIIGYITYSALHEEPVKVQTDKVIRKELIQKVSAPGKIQPVEEVEISAFVSAEIMKLHVKEGDDVEKGQRLVDLDSTRYRAALDQVRAGLYSAKAQHRLAKARTLQTERLLARTRKLFDKELVGQQELEDVETAHKVNIATFEAAADEISRAKATLRLARDEVAKTSLSSPITGKISRLDKEVGEIVMGSNFTRDVIMKVANLSEMELIVEVDENDVVDIELNDEVEVDVDALPHETFNGKVTEISISPILSAMGSQEEATNFEVTVLLTGDMSKLRPGMNATANIIVDRKEDVLTLPIQCITMRDIELAEKIASGEVVSNLRAKSKDALKEVVFVFNAPKVLMTKVKTGISSDVEIELVEGIEEGTEVVCGPYKILHKQLTDGQTVEVSTPEEGDEKE